MARFMWLAERHGRFLILGAQHVKVWDGGWEKGTGYIISALTHRW